MLVYRSFICTALVLAWNVATNSAAQAPVAAPEVVSLATRDGVQLRLSYYPSALPKGSPEARQVTPVVLLHDFKGTRGTFTSLAQRLQALPADEEERPAFAVAAVDLRAHGDSTRQVFPTGETFDLDASRLRRDDLLAMAAQDMEAVRNFLVGKNDAGELNLNKLCLIGAGMGASVAVNWALRDWSAPPLAIGKQGQDVKALVLISPAWSYSGLTLAEPMRFRPLKEQVAWLLIYGAEDSGAATDVRRIRRQLDRFHPAATEAAPQRSSLQVVASPSKLQGDTLLRQLGEPLEDEIVRFLTEQVAEIEHPWINRRGRLP